MARGKFMSRVTHLFACCSIFLLCFGSALAQSTAASAPPPSVTTTESPEVQTFQKIEDAWSRAVNQRDEYGLELVLSPLFVGVSADGDISTRDQQVAQLIAGDDKTLHLDQKIITVRMMGDIAVANGTYELRHKAGSAQVDEKGVFTHVFERVHGGWRCVNSQQTAVREGTSAKHKKQSSADMPFHFPLFSR